MSRVLILDDNESRHREFQKILADSERTHVWTASQAIDALRDNPPYDLLCLDHDLGDQRNRLLLTPPGDGADVAVFINIKLEKNKYPKRVLIHSWNPTGAQRMADLIRSVGINVIVKPFHIR
jgi:CheY-like chemotaxis protein